jgi:hypothetical protein
MQIAAAFPELTGAAVSIRVEGLRRRTGPPCFSRALPRGDNMSLETVQPERTDAVPMRASTPLGRLMFRFVGLLFLAVVALALVWST